MKAKKQWRAKLFAKYGFTALFPIAFALISLLFEDSLSAWFYMVFAGWVVLFLVFGIESTRMVFHAEELLGEPLPGIPKSYRKIEIFCETHPENAAQLKKEYYTVKYLKTNVLSYFISCLACVIAIVFV